MTTSINKSVTCYVVTYAEGIPTTLDVGTADVYATFYFRDFKELLQAPYNNRGALQRRDAVPSRARFSGAPSLSAPRAFPRCVSRTEVSRGGAHQMAATCGSTAGSGNVSMHAASRSSASRRVCGGAVPAASSFSSASGTVTGANDALAVSAPRNAARKCSLCEDVLALGFGKPPRKQSQGVGKIGS